MKKCIILFFLIFFIPIFSSAKDLTLTNQIISFQAEDGYGLQGFTVVKDKLFFVLVGPDDASSWFKVFDLTHYKEIYSMPYQSVGHANDVTYNSQENRIYIAHSSGSSILSSFDGDTYSFLDSFSIHLPIRSITYMEEENKYAVRLVTSGFLLNEDFQKTNIFPFITGMNVNEKVGRQGWAFYQNHLWYANWSWVRLGGDGTNDIMVYDLQGHKLEDFITDSSYGEIEDIAFYQDKMILGFNSYEGEITFYLEDIPLVPTYTSLFQETEEKEEISRIPTRYFLFSILLFCFLLFYFLKTRKKKI